MAANEVKSFWALPWQTKDAWDGFTKGTRFYVVPGPGAPFGNGYVGRLLSHKTESWAHDGISFTPTGPIVAGIYVRFSGAYPPIAAVPNITFFHVVTTTPSAHFTIGVSRTGADSTELFVWDKNGAEIIAVANVFEAEKWYLVEVGAEVHDSTGRIVVWVSEKSGNLLVNRTKHLDSASEDLDAGGTGAAFYVSGQVGDIVVEEDRTIVDIAWPYIKDDCDLDHHFVEGHVVTYYRPTLAAATSAYDEDGNTPGDDLDLNTWDKSGDQGTFTFGQFDADSGHNGAILLGGPLGDLPVGAMSLAAKWLWYGSGELTKFDVCWGYGDPCQSSVYMSKEESDIGGFGASTHVITQSFNDPTFNRVPTTRDTFIIGFGNRSVGTDAKLQEACAAVLSKWPPYPDEIVGNNGIITRTGRPIVG